MVTVALFVRLEAKPGKSRRSRRFSRAGCQLSKASPPPRRGSRFRLGPSTFGIFDAFPNDGGRQAHLSGRVAATLLSKETAELLAKPPAIEKLDVLAAKLPR
jgi:hypothetical protein